MRRLSDEWLGSLILPLVLVVLGAAIAVLIMPVLPDTVQELYKAAKRESKNSWVSRGNNADRNSI